MEVPKLVMDVAAGTISGTIVTCVPLLWRRSTRQPTNPVVDVDGDNNHVHLDQSQHDHRQTVRHTTINVAAPATPVRPDAAPRQQTVGDDAAFIVLIALGVLIVLLFAWPFVLGIALGASVVISCAYIRAVTRPTFALTNQRTPAIIQSILTVIATIASSAFTLFGTPSGLGILEVERTLAARFPGYSSTLSTRWDTLTNHLTEVIEVLGLDGVMLLIGQMAGLVFCVLLTLLLATRAIGTYAALDQQASRPIRRIRTSLAQRVLTTNPAADAGVTVMVAMVAIAFSSGLVADLMIGTGPYSPL